MTYPTPKLEVSFVCPADPLQAFLAATAARRRGVSASWQISGKRKAQLRRAYAEADQVVELPEIDDA